MIKSGLQAVAVHECNKRYEKNESDDDEGETVVSAVPANEGPTADEREAMRSRALLSAAKEKIDKCGEALKAAHKGERAAFKVSKRKLAEFLQAQMEYASAVGAVVINGEVVIVIGDTDED
jgi:hypothetical protein